MTTIPGGIYFVGDPCYMDTGYWSEYCDHVFGAGGSTEPFYTDDGMVVFAVDTMYGDGTYYDQRGDCYPVDAGCIGVTSIVSQEQMDLAIKNVKDDMGTIFCATKPFEVRRDRDGVIYIGEIAIDTNV